LNETSFEGVETDIYFSFFQLEIKFTTADELAVSEILMS
jgi:hypothetical protein